MNEKTLKSLIAEHFGDRDPMDATVECIDDFMFCVMRRENNGGFSMLPKDFWASLSLFTSLRNAPMLLSNIKDVDNIEVKSQYDKLLSVARKNLIESWRNMLRDQGYNVPPELDFYVTEKLLSDLEGEYGLTDDRLSFGKRDTFIESLIVGFPVKPIYVIKPNDIIEGRKKVNAIIGFLNGDFPVNGKRFTNMNEYDQDKFKFKLLRVCIFSNTSANDVLKIKEYCK